MESGLLAPTLAMNNLELNSPEASRNRRITELFRKYQSQLRQFIKRRVTSAEESEDILQDVFYQLIKVDFDEDTVEKASSWLYTVTRNLIIDRHRKQREEEMPCFRESDEEGAFVREVANLMFDEEASPETDMLRAVVWEELEEALCELPEEQRVVFEMTELQGIPFREIADSTGIALNTLISRKRYAVMYLRQRLYTVYQELIYDAET